MHRHAAFRRPAASRMAPEYEEGRHKDAETSFREILRKEPGNPAAIHGLGCIARDRGDLELALDLLARASQLLPELAGIHSNISTHCTSPPRSPRRFGTSSPCARSSPQEDSRLTTYLPKLDDQTKTNLQ